jgi:hypothetical protein
VQYDIPVSTPYQIAQTVREAVASATSAAASITSEVSKVVATPTATGSVGAIVKKWLLRAAGEEGVAERVHVPGSQHLLNPNVEEKIQQFNERVQYETKWRTEWTKVNCIDTSGEAFAIYLNLLYLAPLTYLFGRFFYRAYVQFNKPRDARQAAKQVRDSGKQAGQDTERAIEEKGEKIEDDLAKRGPEALQQVKKQTDELQEELARDLRAVKEGRFGDRRVSDRVANWERQVKSTANKTKEGAKKLVNGSGSPRRSSPVKREEVKQEGESAIEDGPEDNAQESQPVPEDDEEARPKPQKDEMTSQPDETEQAEGDASDEQGSGANNQAEETQNANLGSSQAVREGAGKDEQLSSGENKEHEAPSSHGANNESEERQEENIEDSQALRPEPEEPTDGK